MGQARIGEPYKPLITSSQAFTAGWVNLGPVISVNQFNSLGLIMSITANNSLDMRIRLVARLDNDPMSTEFLFPILSPSTSVVNVEPEFYELTLDADQNLVLSFNLANVIDFAQFQIQAGTVGLTPGEVTDARYSLGQY